MHEPGRPHASPTVRPTAPSAPSTPSTPSAGSAAPPTTTSPATTTVPTSPEEPSLGVGDRLFPELGSADLDVQHYDVELAYDVDEERIDATVTLLVVVGRPLDVVAIDAGELDVDTVTVGGAPATFERTDASC